MGYPRRSTTAIIGAGPYGLSIAAHLRSLDIDFRIFGTPMHSWRSRMPKGMFLKSEGCASSLSDPAGRYTLARYASDTGAPFGEQGVPVSLDVFTRYGLSFQQHLVPMVEDVMVTSLDRSAEGFELRLANGEVARAGKVIVATGLWHTAYIPETLRHLPAELVSHNADHHDLGAWKGRDVTVIGGGQSALETAALLSEAGASTRVLIRRPSVAWNSPPNFVHRSLYQRLRRPMSNLGIGLELWFCTNAPMLFYHLPQQVRVHRAHGLLGPAGAWWLKDRVVGRLPILLGHSVRGAEAKDGGVRLDLQHPDGRNGELRTEHVIAATGYRFALKSLPFLAKSLLSQLRSEREVPVLSPNFESSVPGLYFTGLASANYFGPAMRFLHGAHYTARRVSGHIAAARHRLHLPRVHLPATIKERTPRCKET